MEKDELKEHEGGAMSSDRDEAEKQIIALEKEVAALKEELDDWKDDALSAENPHPDEIHCTCVGALRKTVKDLRAELANLRKNDSDLFCKIMVEAIAGLADAVIVKQAQYSGFHTLKYVKMLRAKAERMRNELAYVSKPITLINEEMKRLREKVERLEGEKEDS